MASTANDHIEMRSRTSPGHTERETVGITADQVMPWDFAEGSGTADLRACCRECRMVFEIA